MRIKLYMRISILLVRNCVNDADAAQSTTYIVRTVFKLRINLHLFLTEFARNRKNFRVHGQLIGG